MTASLSSKTSPHTPGPWRIRGLTVESVPGGNICLVNLARPEGPTQANLALIAAAPDLLALAKQYASECATCDGTEMVMGRGPDGEPDGDRCPDCADIRIVIAKAEGRS